jgi:hypothetical protein
MCYAYEELMEPVDVGCAGVEIHSILVKLGNLKDTIFRVVTPWMESGEGPAIPKNISSPSSRWKFKPERNQEN